MRMNALKCEGMWLGSKAQLNTCWSSYDGHTSMCSIRKGGSNDGNKPAVMTWLNRGSEIRVLGVWLSYTVSPLERWKAIVANITT